MYKELNDFVEKSFLEKGDSPVLTELSLAITKEQTQYGLMYIAKYHEKEFYARSPARATAFALDYISKALRNGPRG